MTNYDAPLVAAVVFSLAAFIAPVYAQQETVAEFQALEWFSERPGVLAMKIEKRRSEAPPTGLIVGGTLIVSSVALKLQSGFGFMGVASSTRISAHAAGPVVTRDADVVVPLDAFQRFLETLLQSPVKEGIYPPSVPINRRTTRVELDLETETVTFFTESLADGGITWGATFGRRTYVIESDILSNALRILDPYISLSY